MSLIDTVDKVTVTVPSERELPAGAAVEMTTFLVSLWARSDLNVPESGSCRVRLFAPSGQEIEPVEPMLYGADLTEKHRLRTMVRLQTLPLGAPGQYMFVTDCLSNGAWKEVARTPYELELRAAVVPEPAPEQKEKTKRPRKRQK